MTDTNQASELFELCKKVYELTGLETGEWTKGSGDYVPASELIEAGIHFPIYTSDYLLEKLPRFIIKPENVPHWLTVSTMPTISGASYVDGFGRGVHTCRADTPLKALLKLCLALKEAGEI